MFDELHVDALLAGAGFDVEIRTWKDLSVFYNQVKNLFDMIFLFIFLIVLVIVIMSVVNTMSTVITIAGIMIAADGADFGAF